MGQDGSGAGAPRIGEVNAAARAGRKAGTGAEGERDGPIQRFGRGLGAEAGERVRGAARPSPGRADRAGDAPFLSPTVREQRPVR